MIATHKISDKSCRPKSEITKTMLSDISFVSCNKLCCLISTRNPTKKSVISPTFAKKKDYSQNSAEPKRANSPLIELLSSRNLITQSAIGVFSLGFIDAGYSGDWSRIGVISRETEDFLKAAAFFVVPLCVFLIFSLSKSDDGQEEEI